MKCALAQSAVQKAAYYVFNEAFAAEVRPLAEAHDAQLAKLRRAVKDGRPRRETRVMVDRMLRSYDAMLVCLVRACDDHVSADWLRATAKTLNPFVDCGEEIAAWAEPKSSGIGWRGICSFGIKRTALHILCADILAALFDVDPCDFMARGRGAEVASDRVVELVEEGYSTFLIADIEDFFRSVQKAGVPDLTGLPKAVVDACVLIPSTAPLVFTDLHHICAPQDGLEGAVRKGLPQGSRVSQIVAVLLLGPSLSQVTSANRIVLFGDDTLIAACSMKEAHAFDIALKGVLSSHGAGPFLLKHCVVGDVDQGFNFLKYHFRRSPFTGQVRRRPATNSYSRFERRVAKIVVEYPTSVAKTRVFRYMENWVTSFRRWQWNDLSMGYLLNNVAEGWKVGRALKKGKVIPKLPTKAAVNKVIGAEAQDGTALSVPGIADPTKSAH